MDVQSALFAEVVARPANDMPWLVLADWLEDAGETYRAELVRLSVVLRHHDGGPERLESERRLRELYALGLTIPLPTRRIAVGQNYEMELVFIPPGRFLMGSPPEEAGRQACEGPVHPVQLTRGFWLGSQLVTQAHWVSLLGTEPPGGFRSRILPVAGVNWLECQEFLAALARQHNREFRLPTEAEWEYACRALTTTPFFHGPRLAVQHANFDGNHGNGGVAVVTTVAMTTPIGSYAPNGFGLCDMHGNVWEWCDDWFGDDYYRQGPAFDPPGPAWGTLRVLRGGSWYSYWGACRSANRERSAPETSTNTYGFRVAMTEPTQSPSP
jgi:sulfatase modifying factor 1